MSSDCYGVVEALARGVSVTTQVICCSEEGEEGYNKATFLVLEFISDDFLAKAQTDSERGN
jgi:hypothetical protein